MDASCRETIGADADGEVVWSWRPLAGVKLARMLCIATMTVTKRSWTRGEHEGNRKTIARGMPVIRLHLWRLRSCASSICTRGRGCWLKHPAFAAPSSVEGNSLKLGRISPRERALVSRTRCSASLAVRRRAGTHTDMESDGGPGSAATTPDDAEPVIGRAFARPVG